MIEVHEKTHATEATSALLFVLNGHASGIEDPDGLGLDLVARAQELGARARARVTHSEAELWDALAEASEHGERVALVGGDGSLHAAANAPLPNLPELALVPAGKANNIARGLGIPVERGAALRTAAAASVVPLDVLRVETPETTLYAVEGVSAGFHAAARHRYNADNSADLKQGLRALGAALRDFAPFRLRTRIDGIAEDTDGAAQLFLSNLPYFAYGFEVDPGADPSDGLLEAIVFQARRRTTLLRQLVKAHGGGHIGRPGVRRTSARTVELTEPLPLVADAVPLGTTTATVTVESARLRVAAPDPGGAE